MLAAAAATVLVGVEAGCSLADDPRPPARLADGTPARPPPVELESVADTPVLTVARMVRADHLGRRSAAAACARRWLGEVTPQGHAVERTGVASESVTLRDVSGRTLASCDGSPSPAVARPSAERWCGAAVGRLMRGRLRDPRLSVVCSTSDGAPLAFAWVQPHPGARYVAVRQPGYVEVYEPAGGLPVRIASTDVADASRSAATFTVSEHDATGDLLHRYDLRAAVAG